MRVWSEVLGLGELKGGETAADGTHVEVFTPDGGTPLPLRVLQLARGPVRFLTAKRAVPTTEEQFRWVSIRLEHGSILAFREGGPPPG